MAITKAASAAAGQIRSAAGREAPQTREPQGRTAGQTAREDAIPSSPVVTPAVVYSGSSGSGFSKNGKDEEALSLLERMMEAQKKAKEQRDKLKLPKKTNYGDISMEAYSRLSRARTQAQVSAAAGYARRQIVQLQAAKRQDSDNGPRIQATINQLKKAVTRAGRKKRELDSEQLTEARRKRLEEGKELRKAQALRQELRRRQKLRLIRERGYLKEAEIDDRFQQQMAVTRMEYQQQMEQFAGVPGAPAAAPAVDGAAAGGEAGVPAAPPELSIQV